MIATPYDLVVMDLQMPIIGLAAIAFAEDWQHCLDAGMGGFCAKTRYP
jgi:hypothetical protein